MIINLINALSELVAGVSADGKLVFANTAFTHTLHLPGGDIRSLTLSDLFFGNGIQRIRRALQQIGEGAQVAEFEAQCRLADSSSRTFHWKAMPWEKDQIILIGEDRLKADAWAYQQILDAIDDMVLVKKEDSRLAWVNASFRKYYGMTNEQLIDLIDSPINEPDYTRRYIQDDQKVFSTGETLFIPDEPVVRHDGVVRSFETVKSAIKNSQGQVTMLVGVSRDITERKAGQDKLQQATEQAIIANRAKNEFLATMSHEIRTPMNGILGMSRLLLDSPLSSEQQDLAQTVYTSAEALLVVLNGILDFAKVEAGKVALDCIPFSVQALSGRVLRLLTPRITEKNLKVYQHFSTGRYPFLMGDDARVGQILINLAGNAVKFTPDDGEIHISLECREEKELPEEYIKLVITVKDTGIGIDPKKAETIFEPFLQEDSSTTRRFGGTGLGLSISRRLANLMGGDITVKSLPGQGSEFVCHLVLKKAQENAETVPSGRFGIHSGIPEGELTGKTALVVEDNPINQKLLTKLLERKGCRVITADNGEEAIKIFNENNPEYPIDFIVMDVQMPGMSGLEASNIIRRIEKGRGSHVPIIACSASVLKEEQEECMRCGMDGFVAKPIQNEVLFREIKRLTRS